MQKVWSSEPLLSNSVLVPEGCTKIPNGYRGHERTPPLAKTKQTGGTRVTFKASAHCSEKGRACLDRMTLSVLLLESKDWCRTSIT